MVLECFTLGESSLGFTELADRLKTNKATMSRVLSILRKREFPELDPHTRRYRLEPAKARMARAVYRNLEGAIDDVANSLADELRDEFEERVPIEVLSGNNIYLSAKKSLRHIFPAAQFTRNLATRKDRLRQSSQ